MLLHFRLSQDSRLPNKIWYLPPLINSSTPEPSCTAEIPRLVASRTWSSIDATNGDTTTTTGPSADTDENWNPEFSPEQRKRPWQSSSSASASSSPSESASATRGRGKGKARGRGNGRGRGSQSVPAVSPSTSQERWHNVEDDDTALQLFQLFFAMSVLQIIVQHTNAYGAKNQQEGGKPWNNILVEDLKSYLALIVYMGLVNVSAFTDYWRRSQIYSVPLPAEIMSCRKFITITNALYLSNPQDDEENEKDACRTFFYFHPNQNISIDERMVASKARSGLKQYMKNKSTKWGYKLFVLTDSLCDYTCEFFVYEGKSMPSPNGLSYESVMALVDEMMLGTGYKLYIDNFYTSPKLFRDRLFKKIWACGTISQRSMLWFREDELLFVEWKDTREVLMCSTFHKAYEGNTVQRRVKDNDGQWFMGGVDLSDALIGFYNVLHKTQKWYQTFFYHFVDIAVVNAFILHQHLARAIKEKPLTQKAFRETLVLELAGLESRKAAPQASNCRLCHQKTPVMCATCEVPLCFLPKRDCFNDWHKQSGKY
ncbi:hypothetical protein ABG768_028118 [Culter alburnus]|uniref:PiggyBac transposable element-derived protein domain-containing protein n=1 Tax=Culter alburnus TaxID=194366 RepID=A0AAW2A990_CULAL